MNVPAGFPPEIWFEPKSNNVVVALCVGRPNAPLPPIVNSPVEGFQYNVVVAADTVPLVSLIYKIPPIGNVVVEKSGGKTVQSVLDGPVGGQVGLSVSPGVYGLVGGSAYALKAKEKPIYTMRRTAQIAKNLPFALLCDEGLLFSSRVLFLDRSIIQFLCGKTAVLVKIDKTEFSLLIIPQKCTACGKSTLIWGKLRILY
jgi:hypothetical protein